MDVSKGGGGMSVTPLIIRGYNLGTSPTSFPFRAYKYNGTDRVTAAPVKTVPDAPTCDQEGCTRHAHAVGLCPDHYTRYRKALKADPSIRRQRPSGFRDDACGTNRGYQRHKYWGVELCQPCRDASNEYKRERKAAKA